MVFVPSQHPRDKQGKFVDVIAELEAMGGTWDATTGDWVIPAAAAPKLNKLLDKIKLKPDGPPKKSTAVQIAPGKVPLTGSQRKRLIELDAAGDKGLTPANDQAKQPLQYFVTAGLAYTDDGKTFHITEAGQKRAADVKGGAAGGGSNVGPKGDKLTGDPEHDSKPTKKVTSGYYVSPDGKYAAMSDGMPSIPLKDLEGSGVAAGITGSEWATVHDPNGELFEDSGAGDNLDWFDTKKEAVDYAVKHAKSNPPSAALQGPAVAATKGEAEAKVPAGSGLGPSGVDELFTGGPPPNAPKKPGGHPLLYGPSGTQRNFQSMSFAKLQEVIDEQKFDQPGLKDDPAFAVAKYWHGKKSNGDLTDTDAGKLGGAPDNASKGVGEVEGPPQEKSTAPPKGTSVPASLDNLSYVKKLGGTTGAEQWVDGTNGEKFVVKSGASPDHVREEALSDAIYQTLGVNVPEHRLLPANQGDEGKPTKVAKFIEGVQMNKLPESDKKLARAQLAKNFWADAWLASWDVTGTNDDNTIVDEDGTVWRIDNGGSLRFRAMGAKKGNAFGPEVVEIDSMRGKHPTINALPSTKVTFGSLTDEEVAEQIHTNMTEERLDKVVELINLSGASDKGSLKNTLIARRLNMLKWADEHAGPKPDPKKPDFGKPQRHPAATPKPGDVVKIADMPDGTYFGDPWGEDAIWKKEGGAVHLVKEAEPGALDTPLDIDMIESTGSIDEAFVVPPPLDAEFSPMAKFQDMSVGTEFHGTNGDLWHKVDDDHAIKVGATHGFGSWPVNFSGADASYEIDSVPASASDPTLGDELDAMVAGLPGDMWDAPWNATAGDYPVGAKVKLGPDIDGSEDDTIWTIKDKDPFNGTVTLDGGPGKSNVELPDDSTVEKASVPHDGGADELPFGDIQEGEDAPFENMPDGTIFQSDSDASEPVLLKKVSDDKYEVVSDPQGAFSPGDQYPIEDTSKSYTVNQLPDIDQPQGDASDVGALFGKKTFQELGPGDVFHNPGTSPYGWKIVGTDPNDPDKWDVEILDDNGVSTGVKASPVAKASTLEPGPNPSKIAAGSASTSPPSPPATADIGTVYGPVGNEWKIVGVQGNNWIVGKYDDLHPASTLGGIVGGTKTVPIPKKFGKNEKQTNNLGPDGNAAKIGDLDLQVGDKIQMKAAAGSPIKTITSVSESGGVMAKGGVGGEKYHGIYQKPAVVIKADQSALKLKGDTGTTPSPAQAAGTAGLPDPNATVGGVPVDQLTKEYFAGKMLPGTSGKTIGSIPNGTVIGTPDGKIGVKNDSLPSSGGYTAFEDVFTGLKFLVKSQFVPTKMSEDQLLKEQAAAQLKKSKAEAAKQKATSQTAAQAMKAAKSADQAPGAPPEFKGAHTNTAAEGKLKAWQADNGSKLDSAHKKAVSSYTNGGYTEMNNSLRNSTGKKTLAMAKKIKAMDEAISIAEPFKEPILLSRRTSLPQWNDAQPGEVIQDNGFLSTSVNQGTWSGNVHLKILAPVGAKGLWVNTTGGSSHPSEKEVILPRGTQFHILKREAAGSATTLWVEIIP